MTLVEALRHLRAGDPMAGTASYVILRRLEKLAAGRLRTRTGIPLTIPPAYQRDMAQEAILNLFRAMSSGAASRQRTEREALSLLRVVLAHAYLGKPARNLGRETGLDAAAPPVAAAGVATSERSPEERALEQEEAAARQRALSEAHTLLDRLAAKAVSSAAPRYRAGFQETWRAMKRYHFEGVELDRLAHEQRGAHLPADELKRGRDVLYQNFSRFRARMLASLDTLVQEGTLKAEAGDLGRRAVELLLMSVVRVSDSGRKSLSTNRPGVPQ